MAAAGEVSDETKTDVDDAHCEGVIKRSRDVEAIAKDSLLPMPKN